jgi:hypothetical protein
MNLRNFEIENESRNEDKSKTKTETRAAIHGRAVQIVGRYKRAEAELIDILQKVDEYKVFRVHGCKNLFEYTTAVLKLSESIAYNFIVVSRKAKEVPQLKAVIESGQLSVSKARKITSVLNKANHSEWLQKAVHMPQKKLEQEVARANPRESVPETMKFVSGDRLNLQMGISAKIMFHLKQAQNIESQRKKRAVNLEETLEALLEIYHERQDPVQKAEKLQNRKNLSLARQVDLRDRRQCTYQKVNGERCEERRWLDVHHVIPKSKGGSDSLDNLTTLCAGHHRLAHVH